MTAYKLDLQPGVGDAADLYQKDGLVFIEEVLGANTLEDYHRRIVRTVWDNERTAIRACHDMGKTYILARIAVAFLNVFPYSKVITTAPTFMQVEKLLWSEIRAAVSRAKWPLGGQLNLTDWKFADDWFAIGFAPRPGAEGSMDEGQGTNSAGQGFHAPHILVLIDEATGVSRSVWTMLEGLMTSAHVRLVAIGNPTSKASEFYQCFRSRDFAKIALTCFDSPNLIANGITTRERLEAEVAVYNSLNDEEARAHVDKYKVVRPYLLTAKWVVQRVAAWGIDHPLTAGKVLGEFPKVGEKTLIPLDHVEAAQLRVHYPTPAERKIIGLDVARFGTDATVATGLHGKKQLSRKAFYKYNTGEVIGETIAMSKDMGGADIIVVDETGIGGGVVDGLKDEIGKALPATCEVRGVQFGAKCLNEKDDEKFVNVKARMFGLLADDMKKADGLALLPEGVYLDELPTINKTFNKKGQMVIESKDDYKKRTGRPSPDSADSLALANFGNYDELEVGHFRDGAKTETRGTLAGSLYSKRNY